jgi:hypothetical protein
MGQIWGFFGGIGMLVAEIERKVGWSGFVLLLMAGIFAKHITAYETYPIKMPPMWW